MTIVSKFTYSAIAKALRRYYLYFDGNSYLQFAPVTLSGDWEVSYGVTLDKSLQYCVLGNSSSYKESSIRIDVPNSRIRFVYDTTIFVQTDIDFSSYTDGAIIDVKHVQSGSTLETFINGESVSSMNAVGDMTFDIIGTGDPYAYKTTGYITYVNINNQHLYELDKNVYPSLIFEDSIGDNDAQGYNFQESSFVRSLPSA